jgi:hypothetical protein
MGGVAWLAGAAMSATALAQASWKIIEQLDRSRSPTGGFSR